ncbi:TonB-dependent receptor domain-containing protein [Luteimonas sp. RIT-PG2_3]
MPIRPCGKNFARHASPNPPTSVLTRLLVSACIAISAQDAIAVQANSAPTSRYEVPSGTLDDALRAFADQSNIQLLYSPMLVRGKHSPGLRGDHARSAGLARLLSEHGLTAVTVNPNTYLLRSTKDQARAPLVSSVQPETTQPSSVIELASVNVTGTRIPRTSMELSFPMTVITAEDIERSGRGTLHDLLSQQPGLVSHHPVTVASEGRYYPTIIAASASLYSLGPRSTLYLLDGRRIAHFGLASAELGGIFDLNSIPLSFIDRIEILRGGASAIYGADAMAGTINIILKKDHAGGEASSQLGISQQGDAPSRRASVIFGAQTPGGGNLMLAANITSQDELGGDRRKWHTDDRSAHGLPDERPLIGFSTRQGTPLLRLPQCQARGEDPDSPYCRFDSARYRTLQPDLLNKSVYAHWNQALGNSLSLHFTGLRTQSKHTLQYPPVISFFSITPAHPDYALAPAANLDVDYAFYEFGAPRNHSTSVTSDVSLGLAGLTRGWSWDVALSHSKSSVHSTIDNVFLLSEVRENINRIRIDGSDNTDVMNAMRAAIHPSGYYSVDTLEATANRGLFDAFGRLAQIELGVAIHSAHRRNVPDPLQVNREISLGSTGIAPYDLHGRDSAIFAELDLPLRHTLQADLAIRIDHHNGFRSNMSPRIGVKWTPSRTLLVRASLGQGYRAPSLSDKRVPFDLGTDNVSLRASPQLLPCIQIVPNLCRVEYGVGENPHLRAEFSRSLTVGVAWAPTRAFSASLDGYRISRTNEFGIADAFRYPSLFPDGLIRDDDGVLYRANKYLANIGSSETQGLEFESNYFWRSQSFGEFSLSLAAHYLSQYATANVMQSRPIDHAGHDVPKLTVLGNMKWQYGNWTTTLSLRHFGTSHAYVAGESCPATNRELGKCTNPSAAIWGVGTSYAAPGGWSYSFGISNLLDQNPTNYRAGTGGYNIAINDVLGRYFTAGATHRF